MAHAKKNVILNTAIQAYKNRDYDTCLQIVTALLKKPNNPKDILSSAYGLQADVLFERDSYATAVESYKKAIQLNPAPKTNDGLFYRLGLLYYRLTAYEKSAKAMALAIKLKPDVPNYYFNLGLSQIKLGDISAGLQNFRKMIELDPENTKAYRNIGLYSEYQSSDNPDYHRIKHLLTVHHLSKTKIIDCHFALAKIHLDAHEYNQAFEHYWTGNDLKRKDNPYDPERHISKLKKIANIFNKSFFDNRKYPGLPTTKPIFIIGLPRSGKTLVEALLSQSTLVYPKEELAILNRTIHKIIENPLHPDYEQRLHALSINELDAIAQHYLKNLESYVEPTVQYITDTTPCNFEYIGFIKYLFPEAKILFCTRNPLDHCLQIYFKNFTEGHKYTNDLEYIAKDYAGYREIMAHWKALFPGEIMEVNYEQLVQNTEYIQKDIFDYIGIDLNTIPDSASKLILSTKEIHFAQHFDHYLADLKKDLAPYL